MSDTSALKARIASELGRALTLAYGNSGETFETAINREINAAIRHYESGRFRWNERNNVEWTTTVAGTRTYSLPADFLRMDTLKLVRNNQYQKIKRASWEAIDDKDLFVSGSSRGIPCEFAIHGNQLRLYPVPQDAYTLVGSYIARTLPTSLSGSYTAQIPFGSYSLTVTSTASHNNRVNGWTTDGADLIKARAKAAVQINYMKVPAAMSEAQLLAAGREDFLSIQEKNAYNALADKTFDALATGRIEGYRL